MKLNSNLRPIMYLSIIFSIYLILVIMLSRFAVVTPDSLAYLAMVDLYATGNLSSDFIGPFMYRPALPLIVSLIDPSQAELVFGILNIGFMFGLMLCTYCICRQLSCSHEAAFVGTGLMMISHPSILYGLAVLLDAAWIFFMALFLVGLLKDDRTIMISALLIGMLFKESTVIILIPMIIYLHGTKKLNTSWALIGLLGFIAGTIFLSLRMLIGSSLNLWNWNMTFEGLLYFIEHGPEQLLFVILPLIPSLIFLIYRYKELKFDYTFTSSIIIGSIPFVILTIFGAAFSSRFLWLLYLGICPILGKSITEH